MNASARRLPFDQVGFFADNADASASLRTAVRGLCGFRLMRLLSLLDTANMTLASVTDAKIEKQVDSREAVELADIRRSLAGDGDAFARIVARHQPAVASRMWRFTRDQGILEQLVHDVFVEAYMHLGSYRAKAPLIHWLMRIATRTGYRHWRREARRRETEPLDLKEWDAAVEPAQQEADEAAELVHVLLARLPPRDRLVLTLFYLEECSVRQIAEQTGWSESMVKVQTHRARKKLKELLKETER